MYQHLQSGELSFAIPLSNLLSEKRQARCPVTSGFLVVFDRMQLIKVCPIQVGQTKRKGGVDMNNEIQSGNGIRVFCRYIVKNGKRIYPKKAKVFCIEVKSRV